MTRRFCYNITVDNEMFARNLPPYMVHGHEACGNGDEEGDHL